MRYYLKLDIDGKTIIGHDYKPHDQYNVAVECSGSLVQQSEDKDIIFYKYKYEGGALVALSSDEIEAIKDAKTAENQIRKKIEKLERKHARKASLEKILAEESLSAEEIAEVNRRISEVL